MNFPTIVKLLDGKMGIKTPTHHAGAWWDGTTFRVFGPRDDYYLTVEELASKAGNHPQWVFSLPNFDPDEVRSFTVSCCGEFDFNKARQLTEELADITAKVMLTLLEKKYAEKDVAGQGRAAGGVLDRPQGRGPGVPDGSDGEKPGRGQ